ncbi:MAG: dsDNA nuclease domain-containing protein [Paracoccaceae bacterium]
MSLADKLEKTPQREVAGSDAYAAFEFQLMFGVELLFEQFDKLDDFAVLFEFHDDIVLLTGADSPSEIEFFQLKHSTKGNWTLAKLTNNSKKLKSGEKAQSILQKLYGNIDEFSGYSKNGHVVSNAYCADFGQSENAQFNAMSDDEKKRLLEHIQAAYPDATSSCLDVLGFRRTELDKTACHELVKGRVHSFLQSKIGGDAFQLEACTNAIVGQCRLKNKKLATDVPSAVTEIVKQKGISKTDVELWLTDIASNKNAPEWSFIQTHLGGHWGFLEANNIRLAYENYKVEALDSGNDAQNALVAKVRQALNSNSVTEPIGAFVDGLITTADLESAAGELGYSGAQLKAMVIYEIFRSQQAGTVQKTDTQHAEENQ